MKKYLNQFIFLTGFIIFISDLIIGHLRCTTVGMTIMFLGLLNYQSLKTRLVLPKIFLLSIMFWIVRFISISIPIGLHFYNFIPAKFAIFLIILLFFLKKFPHHPLKLYKHHVFTILLSTNFLLDLMVTYRFDNTIFITPFFYITLLPIILIQTLSSNAKIGYVSK